MHVAAHGVIAAGLLLLLVSFFRMPFVPLVVRLATAALVPIAIVRPFIALLFVAALVPIAAVMGGGVLWSAPGSWSEALTLALLLGVLVRTMVWPQRDPPAGAAALPAKLFALTAAASAAVQLAVVRVANTPAAFDRALVPFVRDEYFLGNRNFATLYAAMLIVESVGLSVVAMKVVTADSRRALIRVMTVGAAAAAALNVNRLIGLALRSESPLRSALTYLATVRINVHYGDVNAAGSYFVLLLLVAAALTWRGRFRAIWAVATVIIAAALVLTGSRAALAAGMCVSLAAVALRFRRVRLHPKLVAAAAIIVVTLAAALIVLPHTFKREGLSGAMLTRTEMAAVSVRMLATRPVFGIGVGEFYQRSAEFIRSEELLKYWSRENAHNQFLQYAGELGSAGLILFVWAVAAPLVRACRARPQSLEQRAVIAAVSAFLLTCLLGHPLLIREPSYSFWILLGAAAAAPLTAVAPPPRRTWLTPAAAAALAATIIVATVPFRMEQQIGAADLEHVSFGFSAWQQQPIGERYRFIEPDATFFADKEASTIEIPIRLAPCGAVPVRVDVHFDGAIVSVMELRDNEWHRIRLLVPADRSTARFHKLELRTTPSPEQASRCVMVGKIEVRWSRSWKPST